MGGAGGGARGRQKSRAVERKKNQKTVGGPPFLGRRLFFCFFFFCISRSQQFFCVHFRYWFVVFFYEFLRKYVLVRIELVKRRRSVLTFNQISPAINPEVIECGLSGGVGGNKKNERGGRGQNK